MKCLLFAKVRRLFHRDHLSISEIRRRTSLSRNTIKAWLRETRTDVHQYPRRPKVDGKLTPFVPRLLLALDADSRRPKRDRRTALMLFETIKKEGYTGGYSILTDYVRDRRRGLTASSKPAYVPLKFELGEAFQFDWSPDFCNVASGWEKGIVELYSGRVDIHAGNALVARHQRLPGRDQASYD